ncbi:MAG: serine/threonine-protein kinase [Rhodothermales bacterium]
MNRWDRIADIFHEALELTGDERAAFIDEACGGDLEVRREVEAMLDAHEPGRKLRIEQRLISDAPDLPDANRLIDSRVGPYRLTKLLGTGGMGAVYLAERADDSYRQQVAVKLIKPGLHASDVISRFRFERQILARLQHPNIARLLDGGRTDDGLPYLVMDFVDGTPITEYCDHNRLGIDTRLALFADVCRAVQFAHRNLVIHRDLKPSNILVTGDGEVRLLDFGIAKLLDTESDTPAQSQTMPLTRGVARLMTPEYASPEQIRGEPVTTAADIYALGVLLYELLTGHLPFRLPQRMQAEIERIICEEEPTRPSTVVAETREVRHSDGSTDAVTPEKVSTARATHSARLQRALQGDLDNIVLMSLRKEPERRYASAEQVADDIARYLDGRPVIARKPTPWYRTIRFVRRHRIGVSVVSAALLTALITGIAYTASVRAERDRAEAAREDAEQTLAFVEQFFGAADPFDAARRDTLSVRDFLDRAAITVDRDLAGQPTRQGRLYLVLGKAYYGLGRYAEADSVLRLAIEKFGDDAAHRSEAAEALGNVLNASGGEADYEESIGLLRQVLDERIARLGEDDPDVAGTRNSLAMALSLHGDEDEAEAMYRQVLAYHRQSAVPDTAELAYVTKNLALVLVDRGAIDEAESLLRESVELRRAHFGNKHPAVSVALQSLATLLRNAQRRDEAEAPAREAAAIDDAALGPSHPNTLDAMSLLGSILRGNGKLADARTVLEGVVARAEQSPDGLPPYYSIYLNDLAYVLIDLKDYDAAESAATKSLAISRARYGENSRGTGAALSRLAAVAYGRGEYAAAVGYHERAIAIFDEIAAGPNLFSAFERAAMARSLAELRRFDEAEQVLTESQGEIERIYGPDHAQTVRARERLEELARRRGGQ